MTVCGTWQQWAAGVRTLAAWLTGFGALVAAQAACAQPPARHVQLERDVLAALNAARTDPAAYIVNLETYRGFFKANIVVMPGHRVDFETVEGIAPVNEAITYLARQDGIAPVTPGTMLAAAAAGHVAEQSLTGRTGHYGADGSGPGDRVSRQGGGTLVAEVIAYGAVDAADVIRQLIVDDGVPDRGHRSVLFSPHLRFAGVACGPHPEFKTMCVIDLADTPDAESPQGLRPLRIASIDPER